MGVPYNDILSGGLSEVTYRVSSTNQSQNRDFLAIGQRMVNALGVVRIPVSATSGAISFMTGTYHNGGNRQRIETKYGAESDTI